MNHPDFNFDDVFETLNSIQLESFDCSYNKDKLTSFNKLNLKSLKKLHLENSLIGKIGLDNLAQSPVLEELLIDCN